MIETVIPCTYIVDDDRVFRLVSGKQVEKHESYGSNEAYEDGQQALLRLTQLIENDDIDQLPKLILLDINMPIMDGWAFLNAFDRLAATYGVYVVIVTSSIDPKDYERSKRYHSVIDNISKPLSLEKLDRILKLISELGGIYGKSPGY